MRTKTANRSRTLPAFVLLVAIMVHAACHGQGLDALQGIKGDGTIDSYQKIVAAAEPAAKAGNGIAINIYRQALYGLGKSQELENGLQQDDGKPLNKDVEKKWLEFVRSQSDAGDQFYMNVQGIFYFKGYWVEQDQQKALTLWRQAAEKGSPIAHLKMANILAASGGRQNIDGMLEHYTKAADQGNLIALYNLGCLYYEDKFIDRDNERAFKYFQKAAKCGHAVAQRNLGICYLKGHGTAKKGEKAKEWFEKAVDQGDDGSQSWLDEHFNKNKVALGDGMELRIASVKGDIKKYSEGSKIHIAAGIGDAEAVKKMLDAGVDVDKRTDFFGNTPLHLAAVGSATNTAKLLIGRGADVNAVNKPRAQYGMMHGTPLHVATADGAVDIISLLIAGEADLNTRNSYGQTPLFLLRLTRDKNTANQIAKKLLTNGADVNAKNNKGNTPIVSIMGKFDLMDIFISHGANLHTSNNEGKTPHEIMAEKQHLDKRMQQYFEEKGLEVLDRKQDKKEVNNLQHTKLPDSFRKHLLAYYPFDSQNDKFAWDRSGNNNDGEFRGGEKPIWHPKSKYDGAYHFVKEGGGFIQIPNVLSNDLWGFTVSAWVFLDQLPSGQKSAKVIAMRNKSNGDVILWISIHGGRKGLHDYSEGNGRIHWYLKSGRFGHAVSSDRKTETEKWYNIVGVYDGATQKLYVNGQLQKEKQYWSGAIDFDNLDMQCFVGGVPFRENEEIIIDELRIFDCALDDEQVQQLYNSGE